MAASALLAPDSLLRREVLPFLGQFTLLVLVALMTDSVLHNMGWIWIGRWLGIPGTLIIVLSLVYSLRKRKIITAGNPGTFLEWHEFLTWLGSLMVLVHAGSHFNAVLPWLALIGMVFNVLSGMVGKRLLARSRRHMKQMEERYRAHGLSKQEVDKEIFWDSVTFDLMAKWRIVHMPLSVVFALLTVGHIIAILLFWEWK